MVDVSKHCLKADFTIVKGTFCLNVQFQIESGLTVVVGPSGSGKTTLLNCLAGLADPQSGIIAEEGRTFFNSQSKINLPPQQRNIGYVFQSSYLFPHLSIEDNIAFGLRHLTKAEKTKRVKELLSLCQLDGLGARKPSQLSGGQMQRAAIARAIAPTPKMLLLDEPFSALDSELTLTLSNELQQLQRRLSLLMVLVTHSLELANRMADHLIVVDNGRARLSIAPSA